MHNSLWFLLCLLSYDVYDNLTYAYLIYKIKSLFNLKVLKI